MHAGKAQCWAAAEELDMALRLAFCDSKPISLLHEILDIAAGCPAVDTDDWGCALDHGPARGPMIADYHAHHGQVQGIPHGVLADGTDMRNRGVSLRWVGEVGAGCPVVDADDPTVMAEPVRRTAAAGY